MLATTGLDTAFLHEFRRGFIRIDPVVYDVLWLVLIFIALIAALHMAWRHSTTLGYYLRLAFNRRAVRDGKVLLAGLVKKRPTVEIFLLEGPDQRFLCTARPYDYTQTGLRMEVVQSEGLRAKDKGAMAMAYFSPQKMRKHEYNMLRGFIHDLHGETVIFRQPVLFGNKPRRTDLRIRPSAQEHVKVRMWLLTPANGANACLMKRSSLEINMESNVLGKRKTVMISDISRNGLGFVLPEGAKHEHLVKGHVVTLKLYLFNPETSLYRTLWLGGRFQNKFTHQSGSIHLGIRFLAMGKPRNGEEKELDWVRVSPTQGVPGMDDILEAYAGK